MAEQNATASLTVIRATRAIIRFNSRQKGENIVEFVIDMQSVLKAVEYGTSVDDLKPALEFRRRHEPRRSVGTASEIPSSHAPVDRQEQPANRRCLLRQMLLQEWPRHLSESTWIIFQDHMTGVWNTGAFAMFQGLNHTVGAFGRDKVGVAGAHDEGRTFDRRQRGP